MLGIGAAVLFVSIRTGNRLQFRSHGKGIVDFSMICWQVLTPLIRSIRMEVGVVRFSLSWSR